MNPRLSEGAIDEMMAGGSPDRPILQLLGYKKVPSGANVNTERYRLVVSDGKQSHTFAMLATQLNGLITSGELELYTVVRLEKYICNKVQTDKRVLIILDLTVMMSGAAVGGKIGNPVLVGQSTGSSAAEKGPNANVTSGMNQPTSRTQQATSSFSKDSGYSSMNRPYGMSSAPGHSGESSASSSRLTYPISSITPYQNKWTIRARVTNKTNIRTWSNSRGEGKLFSLDLLDESGEIRATAFNDQCDKFYNMIEINKVYYISNATLKTANKNFTSIKNDYEMTFKNDTIVEPCHESCGDVPTVQFDFTPIDKLPDLTKDTLIDVIGICKSAGDVQTLVAKTTNRELKKRDLQLVDQSNMEVKLTLWGEEAEKFDGSSHPVVAVKSSRVSDFGGCSLSALSQSLILINPDIKESHILKGWYEHEGSSKETISISSQSRGSSSLSNTNWKCLQQVKLEQLGTGDKPDYFTCKAHIILVKKENSMYQACASPDCNKKVVDLYNGMYRCEKCNREFSEFKWRLLLKVNIADFSDNDWVTCFQESAEAILGHTAAELGEMKKNNDDRFQKIFLNANFGEFIFKLRTKMESYNDENRLQSTVVSVTPVDYCEYNKKLLADLKALLPV